MKGIKIYTLYSELKHYFTSFPDAKYLAFGTLALILSIYLLIVIFTRLTHKNEPPQLRSRLGIIYSLLVVIFALITLSVYHTKFTSVIISHRLQSSIISALLFLIIGLYLSFKSGLKAVKTKGFNYLTVKEGPIELQRIFLVKRTMLIKLIRLTILLLLPLFMLLINPSSKYLYSIIFDNSPSMETQIALAQSYLGNTSEKLKDNSIFVVTSFPTCQNELECATLQKRLSNDIDTITRKDPTKLVAETYIIERKADLIDYLQNGALNISNCGSPIYEAIWQNFVSSIDAVQNESITKKKLIILSDGEDNLYRTDLGFTKPKNCLFDRNKRDINMNDFFDEISLIKYDGNGTENITSSCVEMNIYEGNDDASFEKSFLEQIEDIYFDKYFLIIVSILLILGILSIQNLK
jgi:hypothetical protein